MRKNMALSCCKIYFLGSNDWAFCKKARIVGESIYPREQELPPNLVRFQAWLSTYVLIGDSG